MKTMVPYKDMPDVLNVEEAAALLRLSRSSAYEAIRENIIPSVRIGRRILVPKSGLRQFIEARDSEQGQIHERVDPEAK